MSPAVPAAAGTPPTATPEASARTVSTPVAARAPAEERGRTEIADRVLEKIAAHALTEVVAAGGAARRVLGVPLGRTGERAAPQVAAQVDGGLAILRMTVSVAYPAPVREVTRRLRDHVTARVAALTGLQVRQVDIRVAQLTRPERNGRQVL
ncbi:Asp23/Gls24 family envelope stress response protein [Actinomadura opuntiae]|uniref:Asp23/Gls24 family envelope stress response protein n=1 Tax=Actinomadura sp. OS1-43 TaxID=604315 RepID=UPI00255B2FC6|nr:Asp23/Gls24 family envelope stress response protein [Actinomadura sp. OS1-43]MDL4818548.1 Asp23/Gls24 family envelope stress response protein [Actinomadura sp. OS1-43]